MATTQQRELIEQGAKAVALGGHAVFTCTLSVSLQHRNTANGSTIAQSFHRAFDARLRQCRWRSALHWTLATCLRKDADDGVVHFDMYLVVQRRTPGRCDNVYAAWRSTINNRCLQQLPHIDDVPRGAWHAVRENDKALINVHPQSVSYRDAVEAMLSRTTGTYRLLSDELRVPRAPASPKKGTAATPVQNGMHAS